MRVPATYYPPATTRAPAVLLLHGIGEQRDDWDAFARALQEEGLAVLALDVRGLSLVEDSAEDSTQIASDVALALAALMAEDDVDGQRTAIVGSSMGANIALVVGGDDADVDTVIAISPGLAFDGAPLWLSSRSDVLANFSDRPVLLVASEGDTFSYESVGRMADLAPGIQVQYFAGSKHGIRMLTDPAAESFLIEWLRDEFGHHE